MLCWLLLLMSPLLLLLMLTLVLLQDMPGWGDEIDLVNNLKTVVGFLLEQRKKDLLAEKAGVTGTCCLKEHLVLAQDSS
jgi:hypothetical protein